MQKEQIDITVSPNGLASGLFGLVVIGLSALCVYAVRGDFPLVQFLLWTALVFFSGYASKSRASVRITSDEVIGPGIQVSPSGERLVTSRAHLLRKDVMLRKKWLGSYVATSGNGSYVWINSFGQSKAEREKWMQFLR
jgi:hypothetical protein